MGWYGARQAKNGIRPKRMIKNINIHNSKTHNYSASHGDIHSCFIRDREIVEVHNIFLTRFTIINCTTISVRCIT